jgi:hypothetical protein
VSENQLSHAPRDPTDRRGGHANGIAFDKGRLAT